MRGRPEGLLSVADHDRDRAGLTYVYPVVSRRAGGVSVGINLNPNNACNWRCIYCQVPELGRGGPPPIDLDLLERELRGMLAAIVHGDFMAKSVPADMRRLNDVAISGNGEPTSAREFPQVVARIGAVLGDFDLAGRIKLILITNGSLAGRVHVQAGLAAMADLDGEVWFKLDRATRAGFAQINGTAVDPEAHIRRLTKVAALCPTWIQTCMFSLDGAPPAAAEIEAYLHLLGRCRAEIAAGLRGVLLYGLARPSLQAEAARLGALPESWLQALAARIEALGLRVRLTL